MSVVRRDNDCTCCGEPIKPGREMMLELDQRTNTYHNTGGVPEEDSQGWFPFGKTCAQKKLRQHNAIIVQRRQH
jgi:hypothetical protein